MRVVGGLAALAAAALVAGCGSAEKLSSGAPAPSPRTRAIANLNRACAVAARAEARLPVPQGSAARKVATTGDVAIVQRLNGAVQALQPPDQRAALRVYRARLADELVLDGRILAQIANGGDYRQLVANEQAARRARSAAARAFGAGGSC